MSIKQKQQPCNHTIRTMAIIIFLSKVCDNVLSVTTEENISPFKVSRHSWIVCLGTNELEI